MALANKIIAFKKHFDIESVDKDVEFMLDMKNNFIAIFQGKDYIVNNQQYKDKFLTYKSMKFKKNYGLKFLHAIRFEVSKEEKDIEKSIKKVQKYTDKQVVIHLFKYVNFVNKSCDIDSMTYVDKNNRLILNEAQIPIVLCDNNPLKITTAYGQDLVRLRC